MNKIFWLAMSLIWIGLILISLEAPFAGYLFLFSILLYIYLVPRIVEEDERQEAEK